MAKFSDIPHFLIKKYYEVLLGYRTNTRFNLSSVESLFPAVQFGSSEETEFKDRDSVFWNKNFNIDTAVSDSYVIGGRTSIVTKGDFVIELFVKDLDIGYRPVWISIKTFGDNIIDVLKNNQINAPVFDYTQYETEASIIKIFNLGQNELTEVFDGQEIYFRKDSAFYTWLQNEAKHYVEDEYGVDFILRNYINTDKNFIYFGKIYRTYNSNNGYRIDYYGMKDYVKDIIPEHQQTERFKELIRLNFDVLSNEMYSLEKNIYTIHDPLEIDIKYLNHLSKTCGIDIDGLVIKNSLKRNLVNELINVIKAKGTYGALYSIWKLVTGNTKNLLNFYDWWHDKTIEGVANEYTVFPSLGYYSYQRESEFPYMDVWFDKYYPEQYPKNQDQMCISTHYTVEYDLSREPLLEDKIISKEFNDKLLEYFETHRPINRICDYKMFISPWVDITGKSASLYDQELIPGFYSVCNIKDFTLPNAFIKIFKGTGIYSGYTIEHNLGNKHVNIQLYNNELKQIIPDEIFFIDENKLEVKLNTSNLFFVLIKKADYIITKDAPEIQPNSRYIQSLFTQDDSEIVPNIFNVQDSARAIIDPSDIERSYSKATYIHNQPISSNIWTVVHELNTFGLLINSYDANNNKIYPSKVEFINENTINIHFDDVASGYSVVTDGEDVQVYNSGGPVNAFTITHDLGTKSINVQTFNNSLEEIIPAEVNFIGDNQLQIKLSEGVFETLFVLINSANTSNNYVHNLTEQYLLTQIMDDGGNVVIPNNLILLDGTSIKCDFNLGTAALLKKNYMFFQNGLSSTWTWNHGLNTRAVLVNSYDFSNKKIYPTTLTIVDENTVELEFDSLANGYILLTEDQEFNLFYSSTPVKEWTINHSFENSLVNVQLFDVNFVEIMPNNIQMLDSNSLKVSFEEFVECIAIIIPASNGTGNINEWLIRHNLNQTFVYSQFSSLDDNVVVPNRIELTALNTLKTDLSYGVGTFSKNDIFHFQNSQSSEWVINHNLAASGVLVNVYDLQNQKVYPSEVVLVNENVVKLVFEEPVQGYCVIISVGSPAFIEIITSAKLKFYYNNDLKYETPIKDIYEDDDYLYISCTIPVTEEFLINKIEILKSDNKVIFTSTCSDLFKSGEVEMNLQYRVSKGNI